VIFVDTPGIHKSTTMLNKRMMDTVRSSAAADVVLYLADASARPTDEDAHAIDLIKKLKTPVIAVINKVDLVKPKEKLLDVIARYQELHDFATFVPVSALRGEGLDVLRKEILARLPEGPALFPEDYLTDQPLRFIASELIREQVLRLAREEVPHAVAVMVDKWEDSPTLVRVAATIYVERAGQKTILIGAGGAMLKKIGTAARLEMEKLAGKKVFLETFVKVQPNWREDPEFLQASDWRNTSGV
jgi:GTP-binding protein Era